MSVRDVILLDIGYVTFVTVAALEELSEYPNIRRWLTAIEGHPRYIAMTKKPTY